MDTVLDFVFPQPCCSHLNCSWIVLCKTAALKLLLKPHTRACTSQIDHTTKRVPLRMAAWQSARMRPATSAPSRTCQNVGFVQHVGSQLHTSFHWSRGLISIAEWMQTSVWIYQLAVVMFLYTANS